MGNKKVSYQNINIQQKLKNEAENLWYKELSREAGANYCLIFAFEIEQ